MNKQKLIKKHISLDINKQIKAVIKEFDEKFSSYFKIISVGQYDSNGVNIGFKSPKDLSKAFLKSKLQEAFEAGIKQEKINTGRIKKRQYENGFKAGQKSMEKEIVEEITHKVLRMEVKSEQRYLSDSGFWSKRELIDKNEVLASLNPTKE